MLPDDKKLFTDELKRSEIFQQYRETLKRQLSLKERKERAIQYIIRDRQVAPRDLVDVTNHLNKFNLPELFKISSVWRDHR
jgi:hypothetical protein